MIIAALLLMQAIAVAEAAPCKVLRGGIADGMCVDTVEPDEGGHVLVSLLPAREPSRPIRPEHAKILDRLLKAQSRGDLDLPGKLLAEGATSRFCSDWTEQCMQSQPLTAWPLGAYFTPNRPYLLPNGSIRVEWMLGVKLNYLSLIAFEGNKLKSIATTPATIPMEKPATSR
jgi:hypothetical protein